MHVRRLLGTLSAVSLVTCASPTTREQLEATPGYVVHGELPRGVAIEDVLAQTPPGGFGVVGDPSTGQLATIVPSSSNPPEAVSSHFSVTDPAWCTNCLGCPATTREIEIGLTQTAGPQDTPLLVQTHSSMNFDAPQHSPSSWISSVGSNVTISTVGTLSSCATFSYYFDIAECGPEDDCVECSPEDSQDVACGLNTNGTQAQVCNDGAWENDGACNDPDECVNGSESSSESCTLLCSEGTWVAASCDIIAVDAGVYHTCALRQDGHVLCWGAGTSGELGDGNVSSSPTPVEVANLDDAVAISAGLYHTCAIRGTGDAVCWGFGDFGQLGDGGHSSSATPVTVQSLSNAVDISAGGYHTCAIEGIGATYCWGYNVHGQLGNGDPAGPNGDFIYATPTLVPEDYIDISAGTNHTCGLRPTGGGVDCAGQGLYGQLGNGGISNQSTMTLVSSLSDAESVSAGNVHTCARLATSELVCWGDGEHGRLGDGEETTRLTPVAVSSIDDAVNVAAGWDHTCAARLSGEIACWGRGDFGQLGNGDDSSHATPQPVSSIADAAMVSAGGYHNCALRQAGQVVCWGYGLDGQLGDGNATTSSTWVEVALP
jgi:alpha-tubulin suppressor-like RCC1 family protein